MGICNATGCCRDYEIVRTYENNGFHNNLNSIEEKIFLNNGKQITNEQLILNKQYFNIINDIRENPSNYINESKSHNLLEIFIKLKPSKPLRLSDNNIFTIISYLENSEEKSISYIEKEKVIKSMINNGNIKNLCLFKTTTLYNDIKENFLYFLEENEDDIDKILTDNYDYVMIISLPLQSGRTIITFIFYDEVK